MLYPLSLSLSLSLSNTSTFPETSPCTRHLALKCSLSLSSHQFDCSDSFPVSSFFLFCYKNSLCSSISFAGRRSKQYISNSIWDKCLKWDKPPILQQRKNHVSNDIIFNSILTRVPVNHWWDLGVYANPGTPQSPLLISSPPTFTITKTNIPIIIIMLMVMSIICHRFLLLLTYQSVRSLLTAPLIGFMRLKFLLILCMSM